MRKPGCIEPVIYFRYPDGHLVLAPYSDFPTPPDAIREEAETLMQVDALERRLQQQERDNWERESVRDANLIDARKQSVRDRMMSRLMSGATSEYEKDFIRAWFQLRADHPRKKYYAEQFQCYLTARHFDLGNRRADTEEFNPDRIVVK
jgi:hypothetical protein